MSYTETDGSKRVGIFAASKTFSKGGKLELIVAAIGWNVPTLTDAKHILNGSSFMRSTATQLLFNAVDFGVRSAELAVDAPGEYDGVANAVQAHRINVIDTCRENDRECFTAAALAAFDARVKALGVMPVEKMEEARELLNLRAAGKLARGSNLIGLINAYPLECQQIDLYERARREREAKRAEQATSVNAARQAIDCAVEQTSGEAEGAVLTLDYTGAEQGYVFVMYATVDGLNMRHTLAASVTDVKRLCAHWAGFVENVRAARIANANAKFA